MSELARSILLLFLMAFLGLSLGRIHIKGISLGNSAIFFVGLIFGHFGYELPALFQSMGLVLFITAVGLSAGPGFLARLRQSGIHYAILSLITALIGAGLCLGIKAVFHLSAPLSAGMLTGAFTTSPGFAAAKHAVEASSSAVSAVIAGYAIVYPIGLIGKVLSIQLIPKILHADIPHELSLIALSSEQKKSVEGRIKIDHLGFFPLSIAVVLGILLGSVSVPLPGGISFSLGMTGGPLLVGLLIGQLGHLGPIDLHVNKATVDPLKELGLMLFFAGSGVEGGHGLVEVFMTWGWKLLAGGLVLVLVPFLLGFLFSRKVLHLPMLNGLSSMSASMTSTPSLAMLIEVAGTDDIAAAYATTYPFALIFLVTLSQLLAQLS